MNKRALLETMRRERAAWENLIAEVGDQRVTEPGADGYWKVKDTVAHMTAYEDWVVQCLEAAKRGEYPKYSVVNHPDTDYRNYELYKRHAAKSWAQVSEESRRTFNRLLELVESFSDEDLNDPNRTAWFVSRYWREGWPLWKGIANLSYEHYHEHMPILRNWLNSQKVRQALH